MKKYNHISIFLLENKEDIEGFVETNKTCLSGLCHEVYTNLADVDHFPTKSGDVLQIVSFDTAEELEGYPMGDAHQKLVKLSPAIKQVVIFDFIAE